MSIETIGVGTAANDGTGDTLRAAFQKVNANFTELAADVSVSDRLIELVSGESFELTAINYDSVGVVSTATVKWSDGSAGTFTTTAKNATFTNQIDAFTITHTNSGKTVTQSAVTRNSSGRITTKPALTVA